MQNSKHKISRCRRRRRRKAGRKTRAMLPRLITSCRETVGEATHAELAFAAVAEFTKSASIEAAAMVSRNQERERERRMVVRRRKNGPHVKNQCCDCCRAAQGANAKEEMQMRIDTRSARAELAKLQIVFFFFFCTHNFQCLRKQCNLWMKIQMAAFAATVVPTCLRG
jgi:predicted ATP-dependent protease